MSTTATLVLPPSAERLIGALARRLASERLTLRAAQADTLPPGLDPKDLLVLDLIDSSEADLEWVLLDFPDLDTRLRSYRALGTTMGRPVEGFHDDPEVDRAFLARPMELPVVRLMADLAALLPGEAVVLKLEVDGPAQAGRVRRLEGLEAIRRGVWEAVAFGDLGEALDLVVG